MVGAQHARTVGNHLLVQSDRLIKAPHRLIRTCKAAPGGEGVGVVGAQNAHPVGNHLLKQGDRLAQAPRCSVGVCEAVARQQGVGVVGAQHALRVGNHLLVQSDRLVKAPRRFVGARKAMARCEHVWMVGTQDLINDAHHTLEREGLKRKAKIPRMKENMMKASPNPSTLEQGTGIVLGGDGAELLNEITGLPTAPLRILAR